MNTLIRMRGYVLGAYVIQPLTTYPDNIPKYELLLLPENPLPITRLIRLLGT